MRPMWTFYRERIYSRECFQRFLIWKAYRRDCCHMYFWLSFVYEPPPLCQWCQCTFNVAKLCRVNYTWKGLLKITFRFLYARLKNGTYYAVAMSVRLSVRPSVRPRFPEFSSTCFEISIWNLVYTFSRWHDMLGLSCITIRSLWPSLQPKVGQTYFLQSWPHQSR